MKPIVLHPVSVLAGLALAGAAIFLTGAAQTPVPTKAILVGEVPAEWWTLVEVDPSQGYTVPLGRYLVVTSSNGGNMLLADGQSAGGSLTAVDYSGLRVPNGTRVAFPPGTLLTCGASYSAKLWGYLEPVR